MGVCITYIFVNSYTYLNSSLVFWYFNFQYLLHYISSLMHWYPHEFTKFNIGAISFIILRDAHVNPDWVLSHSPQTIAIVCLAVALRITKVFFEIHCRWWERHVSHVVLQIWNNVATIFWLSYISNFYICNLNKNFLTILIQLNDAFDGFVYIASVVLDIFLHCNVVTIFFFFFWGFNRCSMVFRFLSINDKIKVTTSGRWVGDISVETIAISLNVPK